VDRSALANFISVVVGFATLGTIIDAFTAAYRAESNFHAKRPTYVEVLSVFFNGFYTRLLPGSPTERRFLLRSLILACVFLILIFLLFSWYYRTSILPPVTPWLPQVILFGAYLFIFWLISAQTRLFIQESLLTKSRLSRGVFVITDVLAASSIFIFLFSAALYLAANLYSLFFLNPVSLASTTTLTITIKKSGSSEASEHFEGNSAFEYQVTLIGKVNDEPVYFPTPNTHYRIYSTKPFLDPSDFIPHESEEDKWTQVSRAANGTPLQESAELESVIASEPAIEYSTEYEHPSSNYLQGPYGYSRSYLIVDRLGDEFWGILAPKLMFGHSAEPLPNGLFGVYGGFSPFEYQAFCVIKGTVIPTTNDEDRFPIECFEDVYIVSGYYSSAENYRNLAVLSASSFRFALSPFFIATMALSLTFYLSVAVTYILKLLYTAPGVLQAINQVYRTVPFALGFTLIGMLLWALSPS